MNSVKNDKNGKKKGIIFLIAIIIVDIIIAVRVFKKYNSVAIEPVGDVYIARKNYYTTETIVNETIKNGQDTYSFDSEGIGIKIND